MSETTAHSIIVQFQEEELLLSAQRVLYYPSEKTLVISDVHLGKAGHFRRYGIPIPTKVNLDNLSRLSQVITQFNPEKLLFLGDLFHSETNSEWDDFEQWRRHYSSLSMTLLLGNHELYSAQKYEDLGLQVLSHLDVNNIRFLHHKEAPNTHDHGTQSATRTPVYEPENDPQQMDPMNSSPMKGWISGHLHPGIKIQGKGRQRIILPCFVQYTAQLVLPAFGTFTGLHLITSKTPKIIAIAENELIQVHQAT
jgi:DNA ligase-associated metallophosphoesterase